MRRLVLAATLSALAALAACSSTVGEGSRPVALAIASAHGDAADTYECAAVELAALATFSGNDGESLQAVSSRAVWSSSNSGVAQVSNGDIPLPDGSGLYYAAGTVLVLSPGTATITAEYAGLRAQYSVSASPIGTPQITPALTRLAPETAQTFTLETTIGDSSVPVDITDVAAWRIVTAGAPAGMAQVSTVVALSGPVDTPFILEARVPLCGLTVQRSLQLGELQALRLDAEQPAGAFLPLGYTQFIRVRGVFTDASAPPQELGTQVSIERLVGEEGDASVQALADGIAISPLLERVPLQYRLHLESADLFADTPLIEARALELRSLRVVPEHADLELRETLQAEAYGRFEDGVERPIRRDLNWSSRDPSIARVATGVDGGEITALGIEGDTVIDVTDESLAGLSAEIAVRSFRSKPR